LGKNTVTCKLNPNDIFYRAITVNGTGKDNIDILTKEHFIEQSWFKPLGKSLSGNSGDRLDQKGFFDMTNDINHLWKHFPKWKYNAILKINITKEFSKRYSFLLHYNTQRGCKTVLEQCWNYSHVGIVNKRLEAIELDSVEMIKLINEVEKSYDVDYV
jgi:hypothetical protein